jgi:hypothetical protein
MNDLESRLRQAMDATVADAAAPTAIFEQLLRRHRRRNAVTVACSAVCVAILVVVVPLSSGLIGTRATSGQPGAGGATLFRGGGRILFRASKALKGADLKWLYPDGRITVVATNFEAAELGVGGTEIMAWRMAPAAPKCHICVAFDGDVYLMNLDGSHRRLILPAPPLTGRISEANLNVALSPDGSQIAYQRVRYVTRDGNILSSDLWVTDLVTGRRKDLGSGYGFEPFWRRNSTIIAAAGQMLDSINVVTGRKSVLMTTADPRVIRGYHATLPGAGQPGDLEPFGFGAGSDSTTFAVVILSKKPSTWSTGQPPPPASMTVALVRPGRVVFVAAQLRPVDFVSLDWGPRGLFEAETAAPVSDSANPPGGTVYTGSGFAPPLSRVRPLDGALNEAAFSPQGNVLMAAVIHGNWRFAPVPDPQCQLSGHCLHFKPFTFASPGTFQAWAP